MMKLRFALFWLALGVSVAFAADKPSTHALPEQFAGWQLKGAHQASADVSNADAANGNVLKEYSFSKFESATYVRDDGRKLSIRLAQFEDATGAFGAFTFYRQPEMLDEKIGDQGASFNNRVLFYRGNNLVDA